MLKNDIWITEQASKGMLNPFQSKLIRHLDPKQKKKAMSLQNTPCSKSLLKSCEIFLPPKKKVPT